VTVLPAIPEAPVQSAPPSRSSKSSNDQSKDFYSYLRSSTHDDTEETSQSVRDTASKPQKREKQTNKTDGSQTADANTVPVQTQNEQPAPTPPISIEAFLGLPVASSATVNGNTASADADSVSSDTAAPSAATSVSKGTLTKGVESLPLQKGRNPVAATINPALLSANAPSLLNISISQADSSQTDLTNEIDSSIANETKGSTVQSLATSASPSAAVTTTAQSSLAFALKLSDGPVNSLNQKPNEVSPQAPLAESVAGAAPNANTDFSTTVLAAAGSQLKEQAHEQENSEINLYGSSPAQPQNIVGNSQHNTHEEPVHTNAAELEPKQDATTAEPVRNVHMQVIGDNNNRVDVQLMDRGGTLHVSVKSGDVNLAQNLQDHMPELTSRLEQQRFQTEVWMPKLGDNAKAEMSSTRDFSSGGNNNPNSNSSSDREGKGQQQNKPDWVDVFENSTRGTGKINQIWHQ
jgi:hypothetical protein